MVDRTAFQLLLDWDDADRQGVGKGKGRELVRKALDILASCRMFRINHPLTGLHLCILCVNDTGDTQPVHTNLASIQHLKA